MVSCELPGDGNWCQLRLLSAKPVRVPSSLNTFSTGFGYSARNQVLKETHTHRILGPVNTGAL